jgi:hypothetical protein
MRVILPKYTRLNDLGGDDVIDLGDGNNIAIAGQGMTQ